MNEAPKANPPKTVGRRTRLSGFRCLVAIAGLLVAGQIGLAAAFGIGPNVCDQRLDDLVPGSAPLIPPRISKLVHGQEPDSSFCRAATLALVLEPCSWNERVTNGLALDQCAASGMRVDIVRPGVCGQRMAMRCEEVVASTLSFRSSSTPSAAAVPLLDGSQAVY